LVLGLVFLACSAFVGCGGSGAAKTAKVSGKVTDSGGAPVNNATVTLTATGGKAYQPSGSTGADGTYTLSTFDTNDGAPPGDYILALTVHGQSVKASPDKVTINDGSNTLDVKVEGALPAAPPPEAAPPAEAETPPETP
jgi:hypothetical protein